MFTVIILLLLLRCDVVHVDAIAAAAAVIAVAAAVDATAAVDNPVGDISTFWLRFHSYMIWQVLPSNVWWMESDYGYPVQNITPICVAIFVVNVFVSIALNGLMSHLEYIYIDIQCQKMLYHFECVFYKITVTLHITDYLEALKKRNFTPASLYVYHQSNTKFKNLMTNAN